MADESGAIIIKKIKKGGHGHHGGAWKVAYADFVTAMMAFFLLLWLLSTTTKEQKEGIAEYFTPTIGLKDSKGIGFDGGEKPQAEGKARTDTTTPAPVPGSTPLGEVVTIPENKAAQSQAPSDVEETPAVQDESEKKAAKQEESAPVDEETQRFMQTEEEVKKAMEQDPELNELKNNVIVTHTQEGLRIDMIDDTTHPMFAPGSAVLTEAGRTLMSKMGEIVVKSPNRVSITGHTDASSYAPTAAYTNWELSGDRAQASRRYLTSTVMESERVAKVVAMADRELLDPKEPTSPRNRRISFVLLKGTETGDAGKHQGLKPLLSVPEVDKGEIDRDVQTKRAKEQENTLREKVPTVFDRQEPGSSAPKAQTGGPALTGSKPSGQKTNENQEPSVFDQQEPPPAAPVPETGAAKPAGKALLSVPAVDLKKIEQDAARPAASPEPERKKPEKKAPSVFDQPVP